MGKILFSGPMQKESLDLDAQISSIIDAFYAHTSKDGESWVHKVLDDAIIEQRSDGLYRHNFVQSGDAIEFEEAVKVEVEYKPVEKAAQRIGFIKADDEQRLVYGVVMEPDATDTEGDQTTAEEIERACHAFMKDYQHLDLRHERAIEGTEATIVENYIAPSDLYIGGVSVCKGCWVMVTKIFSDKIWKSVKSGELTGYSIVGWGIRAPVEEGA